MRSPYCKCGVSASASTAGAHYDDEWHCPTCTVTHITTLERKLEQERDAMGACRIILNRKAVRDPLTRTEADIQEVLNARCCDCNQSFVHEKPQYNSCPVCVKKQIEESYTS